MSDEEPPSTAVVPYEVGYRRPPVEHRFRKGASGNAKGCPKGSVGTSKGTSPLNADRARSLLIEEAYRPVMLREGDKVIELPAIQAVFRAMGVSAMKGNRFAQKTLADLVGKIESEETALLKDHYASAIEYKVKWQREIDRCRNAGLPAPEPLPHPEDILIDARSGAIKYVGPMTPEEKAWVDQTVMLMKVLQAQVTTYAGAARRARSKARRDEHLAELHDYQRQFDQMNDVISPRLRMELRDRSHHPEASKPGEFARKMGIKLPGPPPPMKFPPELLQLLQDSE